MSDGKITQCLFSNISSTTNGGAISNSGSSKISLNLCKFYFVETSALGGVIFKNAGTIVCEKCLFDKCRSSLKENNKGGNVIRAVSCVCNFSLCGIESCWINSECTDSPIYSDSISASFVNTNSSNCIELAYSSSTFSEEVNSKEEFLKFCSVINGTAYRCIACSSQSEKITLSHINIISNKCTDFIVESLKAEVTMMNSIFYGNTYKTAFVKVKLTDCYSDFDYQGSTKTTKELFRISFFTFQAKRLCSRRKERKTENMLLSFLVLLFS